MERGHTAAAYERVEFLRLTAFRKDAEPTFAPAPCDIKQNNVHYIPAEIFDTYKSLTASWSSGTPHAFRVSKTTGTMVVLHFGKDAWTGWRYEKSVNRCRGWAVANGSSRTHTIRTMKRGIDGIQVFRSSRIGCRGHRFRFLQIDIKKSKFPEGKESDLEEREQIIPIPTRISESFPCC